ncbi:hypothetical protein D9M70_120080 [compost metagenome]
MARAAIFTSLVRPRQGSSSGTLAAISHSPPWSMKRVSWKLSMAQRIAAQLAGALRPTALTMPEAVMHSACIRRPPRSGGASG